MVVQTANKSQLPQFALDIYEQLGGWRLRGAITYCGGREVRYGKFNPSYPQVEPDDNCLFDFTNCLRFRPNTNRKSLIIIAIQPSDTYTVWLWREKKELTGEIVGYADDVYCDNLQRIVEGMYDAYIKEYQKGFIRI